MSDNHNEVPAPRFILLKLALGLVAMFVLFYLTGIWSIKDM